MKHESIDAAVRACPICGAGTDQSEPFLSDSRDERLLSASSFASRKVPEYMSHAMVRCRVCDLAYVDRPPSVDELAANYHSADYDSAEEAEDAADAYARAIAPVLSKLRSRGAALEIGTGTGAFLDRLSQAGFRELVGIEPSTAAIDAAPAHRRTWIREGIFEGSDFPPESFDLICCFMTLEHVQDPGALVAAAHRLAAARRRVRRRHPQSPRLAQQDCSAVARRSSTSSICSCSRRSSSANLLTLNGYCRCRRFAASGTATGRATGCASSR